MDKRRERFMDAAGTMYDELLRWREAHEEASLDEIIEQVTPQRRELMGELVSGLALALGDGSEALGKQCPECKGEMRHKGQNVRVVLHGEGESRLKRTYYFCPSCKSGFFPPRRETTFGHSELDTSNDHSGPTCGDGDRLV